jgi:hypothetical protein
VLAVPLFFLLQGRFGLDGVALASTLAIGGYTAVLTVLWYRRSDTRGTLRRALEPGWRAVPIVVGAAGAAFATASVVGGALGGGLAATVATMALACGVFAVIALALGTLLHGLFGSASRLGP